MSDDRIRRPRSGGGRTQQRRGFSLQDVESQMLEALVLHFTPRVQNRSETMGGMIRAMYELLHEAGKIAPDVEQIAPSEYQGWAARWGIKVPKQKK